MELGPTAKHYPAWNPQCTQWFRAEEFPLLCPTPKVMPRFSLGDVGEAWWPLSHRWTDTSPILPDAAHYSRNQGRVVSLSVLSPLSECVRLPAARTSSQLARSAESLVADAERSSRRVTCLLHIISDVTRVRHAQGNLPSQPSVRLLLRSASVTKDSALAASCGEPFAAGGVVRKPRGGSTRRATPRGLDCGYRVPHLAR